MNQIWSKYIQGPRTLYESRRLRFGEDFRQAYQQLFGLSDAEKLRILEIGCGPGALAGALHRWYPQAEMIGIDRDSDFISFARDHVPGVNFLEADAAQLPFPDESFDVTISNTVSEHVEPASFYGEQLRVLKPGGICLVLSSRKGIQVDAPCLAAGEEEQRFWEKVRERDCTLETYCVGHYAVNEAQLPLQMAQYGFREIRTGYVASHFTPDHPETSREQALAMIRADLWNDLEAVDAARATMPQWITHGEAARVKELIRRRYEARIALYNRGEAQWDTRLCITMVVRGRK